MLGLLWRYVQRTNIELARFVDAVRFGDLSQNFTHRHEGSGFGEFGEALEQGMRRLREERHRLSDSSRFYEAVLDDAPTALLTVDGEGRVDLANKAARRMLTRHQGVRVEDFRLYGDAFANSLADIPIGRPRLVPLTLDAVPQTAMVSAASVHRLGGTVRVIAVQPIQGELNAVEIAAQSDMIRVLTHEIMNSMTPVTSLAHTAADLIRQADGGDPLIGDARAAVETLARRADGVMHFVESYRQISRTPEVRRRLFDVEPWARELEALFRASPSADGVDFRLSIEPATLTIDVDPDLMCQVLLNLVKNGAEAAVVTRAGRRSGSPSAAARADARRSRWRTTAQAFPKPCRGTCSSPFSRPRQRVPVSASVSLGRWCWRIAVRSACRMAQAVERSSGSLFRRSAPQPLLSPGAVCPAPPRSPRRHLG
jgi:nitrogen fixation/metabolism regulation signal transduction histidine kinase